MAHRYLPLLIILLLGAFSRDAGAARVLDHYDVDSLSGLATLIVRAEVGEVTEVKTRDGDCAVCDMTVLSTLQGEAKPQSVIRVAGIDEYRKGPGIEGVDKSYPRISKGDVVYLFLVPKGTHMGYAKYNLTNADWKIIESGARLVVKDRVYAFGQYFPPGPSFGPVPGFVTMTDKTFPRVVVESVESFEQHVATSVQFVGELKRKVADGSLTAAERQTTLQARIDVLKKELAYTDYIPRLVGEEQRWPATRP